VKRMAVETLDHDLALQTEPDAQLRLAEAALRKNPENKEIKNRLASVLARKEQRSALVDRHTLANPPGNMPMRSSS